MRKTLKRTLAILLAVIMIGGAAPAAGLAGLGDWLSVTAAAKSYSGTCGDNLTWTLDTSMEAGSLTGKLVISGTGKMYNYYSSSSSFAPWYSYSSYIKTLTIGNSVTSIGEYAFYNCTGLTSVTIGDSVTSIGGNAFRDCTGLTSVTIPDSVTSIGDGAFFGTAYYNNADNWTDGVLYIGKYLIKANASLSGAYTIKESTLCIAYDAFYNCTRLTSVTIPDSVTSIDGYAFRGCTGLTSVTIPDSVTSIGTWAFYNCKGLTSVTIPDSVTSIGNGAFEDCTGLTSVTIPDGVTSIGNRAFYSCRGLTSVTIPDSVTSIGEYAFYYCTGLTSVTIPDSVTSIGGYAFRGCTGLTSVTIGNSVTRIGGYAFHECTGLTSVTIPDSVTSIGECAFARCSGLTNIVVNSGNKKYDSRNNCNGIIETESNTLISGCKNTVIPDSVTSIGKGAFWNCTGLTSVTIGNDVTSIGGHAFYGCTGLTSVTIGNDVTSIGDYAFYRCTGLTSVTIPDSVTSIGYRAFYNCTGLKDVYYTGTQEQWGKIYIGSYNDRLKYATIHYNYLHDHNYTSVVTSPTCTEKGYTTHTCSCGDSYVDSYVNALGHDFGEWQETTPATYTSKGVETRYCSRCEATETRATNKIAHTYTSTVTPPTCTEKGYTTHTCSCGDSYVDTYVNALGHAYAGAVTKEATYTQEGEMTYTCTRCGDHYTVTIPKLTVAAVTIHNYTPSKTVDYKATITFAVDPVQNPVDGGEIHWFINDKDVGKGNTYTVTKAKESFAVQAKYMKDGKVLAESGVESVNVKTGFFAKLAAFFRSIFGALPKVVQGYLGADIVEKILP